MVFGEQGGANFNFSEASILRQAIDSCRLEDLGFVGHQFTWNNNRGGDENIQERLDILFSTQEWKDLYPGSFVTHLEKRKFDHLPLLLCLKDRIYATKKKKPRKLYRFEEMWLRDEGCADVVSNSWGNGDNIISLQILLEQPAYLSLLGSWSKETFGDFGKEMKECKQQMETLVECTQTHEILNQMRALDERMDELEEREERYWRQRSRQDWLQVTPKLVDHIDKAQRTNLYSNGVGATNARCNPVHGQEITAINEVVKEAQTLLENKDNGKIPGYGPGPAIAGCKAAVIYGYYDKDVPQLGWLLAWYKSQNSAEHKVYVEAGLLEVLQKREWGEIEEKLDASSSACRYYDSVTGAAAAAEIKDHGDKLAYLGACFNCFYSAFKERKSSGN
uniref:Uncharacterized protein n=1 Tax=Chenopodium quinoa TaxID=63459 RepID=A0A803MZ27_CHEQI